MLVDNIFKPNKNGVKLILFGFIRFFKWLNLAHKTVEFMELKHTPNIKILQRNHKNVF